MSTQTNQNERLIKLLQAPPQVQAEIDRILAGGISAATELDNKPALLTLRACAKYLSCSRASIYRLIAAGKLRRTYLLAGSPRIFREDLEAIASGKGVYHA